MDRRATENDGITLGSIGRGGRRHHERHDRRGEVNGRSVRGPLERLCVRQVLSDTAAITVYVPALIGIPRREPCAFDDIQSWRETRSGVTYRLSVAADRGCSAATESGHPLSPVLWEEDRSGGDRRSARVCVYRPSRFHAAARRFIGGRERQAQHQPEEQREQDGGQTQSEQMTPSWYQAIVPSVHH